MEVKAGAAVVAEPAIVAVRTGEAIVGGKANLTCGGLLDDAQQFLSIFRMHCGQPGIAVVVAFAVPGVVAPDFVHVSAAVVGVERADQRLA